MRQNALLLLLGAGIIGVITVIVYGFHRVFYSPMLRAWLAGGWQNLKPQDDHERSGAWFIVSALFVLIMFVMSGPVVAGALLFAVLLGICSGWYQGRAALRGELEEETEEGDDADDDGYDGGDGSSS